MKSVTYCAPSMRIIPQASAELEWSYLVNETLMGEKAIVPLLGEILRTCPVGPIFKEAISRQLDEEVEHVLMYFHLVGSEKISGSGYDTQLKDYVRQLESPTLKLFALQAMLEGIALGALDHRIKNWEASPSTKTDVRAQKDEADHVACAYPAFLELISFEGKVEPLEFKKVARDVNSFFKQAFSGQVIAGILGKHTGTSFDADQIDSSQAMMSFKKVSAQTLVATRNQFLKSYSEAVNCVKDR